MGFAKHGAIFALAALAFTGLGLAHAGDAIVPKTAAANAPGSIRTETCVRPEMPKGELKQQHERTITLMLLLGADGIVKKASIHTSSGNPALDEATLVAISKCRFHPPLVDGKAVEAWTAMQYAWMP